MALDIGNSGLWWLPEKPDIKLSGSLIYPSGNEAILSLNGIFDEETEFHEIILGDVDGHKFTLVNCLRVSYTMTYSGKGDSSHSEFKVIAICKGQHFLRKGDLVFNTISVRYSHVRHWLGTRIGGGEKDRAYKKARDPYMKKAIEKSLFVNISPQMSIEIEGFLEREDHFYYSPYNQETDVIFHLKGQKLNEIIEKLDDFRNFLAICIDEPISIVSLEAREKYGNVQIIVPSILKHEDDDRIYFIPEPIERFLFIEKAEVFLRNWYHFVRKYEPVSQLFFSDNFERLYVTTRFLNYAQAIEAYHARNLNYGSLFFPNNIRCIIDEFTNFKKTIKTIFHNDDVSSLVLQRFRYLNRKSLEMILEDLFKDYKEIFSIFIKDENNFIKKFVKMRNYYTHYNPKAEKPSAEEIVVFTENARFILLSIFLKEIGATENNLKSAIYRYCRKRVREIKSL